MVWITGLSGAGKTTLAAELVSRLQGLGNIAVLLDGDELRTILDGIRSDAMSYDRQGRLALGLCYAKIGQVLAKQGVVAVIATISLFKELHDWNRRNLPGYFEVYLRVPLEELRRRDPKGIYQGYDAGRLQNVAGLDLAIDEPEAPDLVVQYEPGLSIPTTADSIIGLLQAQKGRA